MSSSSIGCLWIKVLILWVESEPKFRINIGMALNTNADLDGVGC